MSSTILRRLPLVGFPWPTLDPFLFCVHHVDHYPAGKADMSPNAALDGRNMGQDFANKDGWNMYHGSTVPGFPQHPHRGFETITITRQGLLDHSDSLGATARFGNGDVQWMTAGAGIVHAEMFPLRNQQGPNTAELFQIWINLPSRDKMAEPHFRMLWREQIPSVEHRDGAGRMTTVTVAAGSWSDAKAPAPPTRSWAASASNDVAIWTLRMAPHAEIVLPATAKGTTRTLYFFEGTSLRVDEETVAQHLGLQIEATRAVTLQAGVDGAEVLVLQGRPIGEPVAQHGPFVMNTQAELQQAFFDYRRTQFGGWPWPVNDPVHAREVDRFAIHPSGEKELPPQGAPATPA